MRSRLGEDGLIEWFSNIGMHQSTWVSCENTDNCTPPHSGSAVGPESLHFEQVPSDANTAGLDNYFVPLLVLYQGEL